MKLRFLETGNRRVLQQMFIVSENGQERQEWRDIPLQKASEKKP